MRKVLYSLIPLWLLSVYLYGWRAILMPLVLFPVGILAEYWMERVKAKDKSKVQVTEAVLVSSALFSLSLPPGLPIWMGIIGILFAVIFGKMVFGGFGRNVFNPAITGRVFIYLAFPAFLGTLWMVPGAAGNWNPSTLIMEWLPTGCDHHRHYYGFSQVRCWTSRTDLSGRVPGDHRSRAVHQLAGDVSRI